MCGIAGYCGRFSPKILEAMTNALAHRGPDGQGVWYDQASGVGLAHTRLAIIDLSRAAHQPMEVARGRVTISYNGEIYNFRELRDTLLGEGWSFNSGSDTEVLANLYLRDGTDMLAHLNGIYAFAIWDSKKQELFLARDNFGVKPLYYSETPKGVIFASELKALLLEGSISSQLNSAAIARHLTYLWSPAPDTILQDVQKLEPGTAMLLHKGRIVQHWHHSTLPTGRVPKEKVDTQASAQQLREHVETAVERQMVADVPVGAFLSGGLDSSAVVAFARHHVKSGHRLQCFTIGFDNNMAAANEGMNADLPYAQKVAKHLDVDLHEITVGPDMIDQLADMIWHLDEPLADLAPLNVKFIASLARQHGIKVLLSGAGGDDIFTGYRRHHALKLERYWAGLPQALRKNLSASLQHLPSRPPILRRLRKAFEYAGLDANDRLLSYFFWQSPEQACTLLSGDPLPNISAKDVTSPLTSALESMPENASQLDQMLLLEQKFFLADHNLNYTDKMTMAVGVEARVPLLDPDLVNFAAALPDDDKCHGKEAKWLFKKSMEGILPDEVIYRPKTGFGAPLRHWLQHDLRPMVDAMLSRKSIEERGLFHYQSVQRLIDDDRTGRIDGAYSIFGLICIELWCLRFIDQRQIVT